MNNAILCFVVILVAMGRLPAVFWDPLLLAGIPFAVVGLVLKNTREVSSAFLAVVIVSLNASVSQSAKFPADLAGQDLIVDGVVGSLPQPRGRLTRFQFDVIQFAACDPCHRVERISLAWYGATEIRPGERWRFTVRLNRPRGSVNPGLFDYEGWLFAHGIHATGYIRASQRLDHQPWRVPHHQLRYRLLKHIRTTLDDSGVRGLITALTLGESGHITPRDWKTLSWTGTNHLFIISGLHVGLVTVLFYRLFLLAGQRRSRAGLFSLGAAFIYGAVAGLGLPVQRALIMAAVAMIGIILNRKISPVTLFCFALLGVTLVNPLAFLSAGFWLSFGAVFSLLFAFAGRRNPAGISGTRAGNGPWAWAAAGIQTQWVVYVGMLPLLLFHVFQVSLLSFLINIVAIPWIGVFVVPVLLAGMALLFVNEQVSALFFSLAEFTLTLIWRPLAWVAEQQWIYFAGPVGLLAVISGMLGACLLLGPRGFLPRWPGVVLLLPLFTPPVPPVERGGLELTVLDVGQGLSVILRTRNRTILYDAGPKFGDRFDAGEQIVTPYIRRLNVRSLDAFILSHLDNDHAGGAPAVLDNFLVHTLWSSEAGDSEGAMPCAEGAGWVADDVYFRLIPLASRAGSATIRSQNDRSCVLLVRGADFAVLLPGDIETATEQDLLRVSFPDIDVMIAPHHGSRSSSSPAFLNHVMPDTVIVSAGYNNRFSHPDPGVIDRYRARHTRVLTTAQEGAITVRFKPGRGFTIRSARRQHRRFWHDRPVN